MEVDGVFLDVRFDRKEILIDEGRDFIVGIGFGLQPNARPSSRSRAEIEQQCRAPSFNMLCQHASEFRGRIQIDVTLEFDDVQAVFDQLARSHQSNPLTLARRLRKGKVGFTRRASG